MLRRLLRASYDIQARVHSHEALPRDLVDMAERAILEVAHEDSRKDFRAIDDLLAPSSTSSAPLPRGKAITGTASGFQDLDSITGGFQAGNLIILAASPSMGKSGDGQLRRDAALGAKKRSRCSRSRCPSPSWPSASSPRRPRSRRRPAQGQGAVAVAEDPPASNRLAESPLYIDDSPTCRCSRSAPRRAGSRREATGSGSS